MAFSTHDQVPDSPTNSHCTWNRLAGRNKNSTNPFLQPTFSEGNTKVVAHATEVTHAIGTIASSGKHYAEFIVSGGTSSITGVGVISSEWDKFNLQSYIYNFGGAIYAAEGTLYSHTTPTTDTTPDAITTSFRVGIEVDFSANEVAFFKVESNGTKTQQGSTITTNIDFKNSGTFAASLHNSSDYVEAYFNQDDWWGTPNSGYTALSTANLPDPAIDPNVDDLPEDYFKAVGYAGNESALAGTTDIGVSNNIGFQPDLIWAKARSVAYNHIIIDSLRPHTDPNSYYRLHPDLTNAEADYNDNIYITNNGFNCYARQSGVNENSQTFVAWCWKAGGSPSGSTSTTGSAKRINTSGTQDDTSCSALASAATSAGASNVITPTLMSINQKAGFSIVKYNTGQIGHLTGGPYSIPHGIGTEPKFIIIKSMDNAYDWLAYHRSVGNVNYTQLNENYAVNTGDSNTYAGSNTEYVVNIGGTTVVAANGDYIMYSWSPVEGYSAFGLYTGNGSADGPFVYIGHKIAFLLLKRTDSTNNWYIADNAREPNNPAFVKTLSANLSNSESNDSAQAIDFLSNGFKVRTTQAFANASGGTYIFMAFAEMPFKYSATNAR